MQLVVNTGSTSKKYALYDGEEELLFARFEEKGEGFAYTLRRKGATPTTSEIDAGAYDASLQKFLDIVASEGNAPRVVGVRVVAPGTFFLEHRVIDEEYMSALAHVLPYAPLHITPALHEIERVRRLLPRTKLVAASDSAFHKTIPEEHRRYSIKDKDTRELDLYRFGYHGLSAASVMRALPDVLLEDDSPRTIVCHVGGGASVTIVKEGKSLDTSMGFSPASGLHMGTRTGDVDPGALMYLASERRMSLDALRTYVNKEGGMKGVYGKSDMREVLSGYEKGEETAKLAIEMFVSRIKKHIGAGYALLGGLDTLVLTATAVERNSLLRKLITADLEHLGIVLDSEKNEGGNEGENRRLDGDGGKAAIAVIHTDEMGEIARIAHMHA